MLITDVIAHLERFITNNRRAQDRLVYDMKCFRHRSNIRDTAERLAALTVENDVCGDILSWIQDRLDNDRLEETALVCSRVLPTSHDGALTNLNGRTQFALDDMHCDVLV